MIKIDSALTFNEALGEQLSKVPKEILDTLILKEVTYYSFDGELHLGQLVISREVEGDINKLFAHLREIKFPINKVVPISQYSCNDFNSMEDNNSSAFNFRVVFNTDRLSQHAYGTAIDLNPRQNPYFTDGVWYPSNAIYDVTKEGTIAMDSSIVKLMESLGWVWGGSWEEKDYHHFNKRRG